MTRMVMCARTPFFLTTGVLRFFFVLLSNVQFLVLVNLPPGLATTRVVSWSQSNTALMCGAMESMHHSCYNGIQWSFN